MKPLFPDAKTAQAAERAGMLGDDTWSSLRFATQAVTADDVNAVVDFTNSVDLPQRFLQELLQIE